MLPRLQKMKDTHPLAPAIGECIKHISK
jgi:hypothetical protein